MNEDLDTILTVKHLLDESAKRVPAHVQARLDLAISKAVALHTPEAKLQPALSLASGGISLSSMQERLSQWFNQPALSFAVSALVIVASATGVIETGQRYYDAKITEVANLDAEILGDDLPPTAYADGGFVGYTSQEASQQLLQTDDQINQWMDSIPGPAPSNSQAPTSAPAVNPTS